VQHVQRLQQGHGWLEEDWIELQPQLRAVAEGYDWYDPDCLRAAAPVFTELYLEHIALEENSVYPESRRRKARVAFAFVGLSLAGGVGCFAEPQRLASKSHHPLADSSGERFGHQ
jgi:hypothetical protein